jgi:beta-N-acetylhexosaminidase
MKLRICTLFAALVAAPSCTPAVARAPSPLRPIASQPLDAHSSLTPAQQRWVDSTLGTLSLRDRVGQMVMVWVLGDYTSNGDSSFAQVRRWIAQDHIGGVSMSLGTPIEVAAKINSMQRLASVPLIVSSDLEPGLGRLEGGVFSHYLMDAGSATIFPSNMAIGATGHEEDAHDVARAIGEEARAVGIQIDFAPVVDVNNNPNNPVINTRSFGEDPARVARLSALFVRGLQETGTVATAKHFPGHGDTDVDSHLGLPVVSATMSRLDSMELLPFRAAINAGAGLVMTAHIALPAITGDSTTPATLSPRIITGLLRDSLGFHGVTITDAMTMEGVGKGYTTEQSSVLAVNAGDDILLKPTDPTRAIDAVVAAVERGEISRARIDSAARHILSLKARVGLGQHRFADLEALRDVVGSPAHRALAAGVAQRAITLLRDRDSIVPARGKRALVVQYVPETELKAGRVFGPAMLAGLPGSRVVELPPNVSRQQLDSIGQVGQGMDDIVVAAYVRRIEGAGGFALPQPIAAWIDSLAGQRRGPRVVVAAFGNPYLIRQFPNVGSYLVTYGVSDDLELAAARAILGSSAVTGRAPISLPGFFRAGDGVQRTAVSASR